MNGHKNGGQNKNRTYRTIKVAPTTRAIRSALAISATMLALSGSGAALAGTCAVTALNEVTCNGVFTDSVDNSVPVINLVPDLTLVIGDDGATTVDPAAGVTGLTSTWGGDAVVITYAEINTSGADGIYMYSDETATLSNYGSIYTYVTGAGQSAVDISAYYDVTVVNGGDLTAVTAGAYGVTALQAYSEDGIVSIDNQATGTIEADAYSGSAIGIAAYAYYGVNVNNDGDVAASSFSGSSTGITVASFGGDVSVTNGGTIESYSLNGQSTGISAFSFLYDATVSNDGGIYVGGAGYAEGIDATSLYGTATITNTGTLEATSYLGAAVGANAYGKYADVNNSGDITVVGETGATGIQAYGIYAVNVSNSSSIDASANLGTATGIFAQGGDVTVYQSGTDYVSSVNGTAFGIYALGNGDVSIDLSATSVIDAYSEYYNAIGVTAQTYGADTTLSVDNAGSIYASAYNNAIGASLGSSNDGGAVSLTNSGYIGAYAVAGAARGVNIVTNGDFATIDVANSGTISATAGTYYATGVLAYSAGLAAYVTVDNSGYIYASATGAGNATGVDAVTAGEIGDIAVYNSGTIDAYSYGGAATGISTDVRNYGTFTYVGNSGSITATSYNSDATGIYATNVASSGYINVNNSGYISAYAYGEAFGINAIGNGNYYVDVSNSGDIYAYSSADEATGIYAYSYQSDIGIDNSGTIEAYSDLEVYGIDAYSYGAGNIDIVSSGDITAVSFADRGEGINAVAYGSGDINVDNSGTINLEAYTYAYGIYAYTSGAGDITANNSGSISVTSDDGEAVGIKAFNDFDSGAIYASNSGYIAAYAYGEAFGIEARGYGLGDTNADNSGDIYAYSSDDEATGIYGYAFAGNVYVSNSGSIEAYSYDEAYGIDTYSYGAGIIDVSSSGSIDVASSAAQAEGINAVGHGAGNVYVDNSGSINVYAYGVSSGIYAYSALASVYVYNSGDIYASSYFDYATGIDAQSPTGNAYVNSSGGSVAAYTVYGVATGINADSPTGDATVINGSDVTATGAIAVGINANAPTGTAYVYNYGSVGAYSYYDGATAVGINAYGVYADVNQSGSVYAYAGGYDFAMASGVRVFGDVSANFYSGGGSTDAVANAYYGAIAEGAVLFAPNVSFYNAGDISASASASGEYGSAVAIGVRAIGDYVDFYNAGSIYAYASAYSGQAIGGLIDSTNSVIAYNTGDISAVGAGPYVNAVGLDVYSNLGDSTLFNYGSISASSDYWAIGVELDTDSYGYIYNGGTIEASGGYYSIAIYSTGLSPDTIVNYGTITGSIWTGEGDDYLLNAAGGVWNAIETSYFGNGDDVIVNHGLIAMDDATIDLGYHAVYGNGFYNFGTVSANGTNYINMGSGTYTLVPSLNPNPFYNYGAITFQDGAADDMLTITGDFAGDGDINVDVSGLDGVSDILYIDGSVVDGTVGTINVDLLDLPTSIETTVPMLYVSGDSVASNFVLGNVNWDAPDSFVSLDFSLIADIDATNVDPDVFSLGIEVTGLSDAGTITAAVPGVVQSLMNTQVGTWRQRMGVIDSFSDGAVSLWARVFYDRGSFSPEHTFANFGPGGNFEYDEFNSGAEAGVDFAVTDEFSLGLLLSKSRGKASLEDPGVGTAKVEADTWGVYGTWISPNGFYLDASYRWMSFDTTLESSFGVLEGDGDAEAFNIEVGYAWTLAGGLKIEPQFQYTRTNVDNLTVFQTASGMTFTNDGGDSSRGRLGVSIRKSFGDADDSWMWTPYATLSAVREFDGENAFAVNNTFFGTTTVEGTSALLELGFTARHENWAIYGGLNWQDGGAVDSFFGGQLGVRYTFGGAAPAPAPVAPPPAKTCADLDDDGDGVNNCDDKCLGTAAGTAVGQDGCPVPAPEPEPAPEPKPFRG